MPAPGAGHVERYSFYEHAKARILLIRFTLIMMWNGFFIFSPVSRQQPDNDLRQSEKGRMEIL